MKRPLRHPGLFVHFFALAFLFCAVFTPFAVCQEPGKIVDQYVKAAGGGRALAKIQTLTLEGTFTSDDGKSGTYTLDTKLPNRYYSELLVGEKNQIAAYNGKSAWPQNAGGELVTLVGSEGMQLEAAAQYYNSRLLNLKKNKITLMLAGHAQVRGKDALQLEVTTATGVKRQVGELSIRIKAMSSALSLVRRSDNLPEVDAIAQTTN